MNLHQKRMFYFKNLSLSAIVNVENLKAIFVSSNYQACQATTFNWFRFIVHGVHKVLKQFKKFINITTEVGNLFK